MSQQQAKFSASRKFALANQTCIFEALFIFAFLQSQTRMTYYAHSLPDQPQEDWETMREHEELVANYCRQFLIRIDPSLEPWGDLLGKWHDLGKYHPDFQAKIKGKRVQIEHAGAGARLAVTQDPQNGLAAAFAIAGHHAGLANLEANIPDFGPVKRKPLTQRIDANELLLDAIKDVLPPEFCSLPMPELPAWIKAAKSVEVLWRRLEFFTRVMFSALVDADRVATGEFYSRAKGFRPQREKLQYDSLEDLRGKIDQHIDGFTTNDPSKAKSPVNQFRAEVLEACRTAAPLDQGLFALTVPTGGGKTLSAMSFALRHAIENKLDRVIVVIPYTSIIRQNANTYREAFGTKESPDLFNVVEHHSGIDEQKALEESKDSKEAEIRRRIAVENWDAPVIVTTSVQFFESLFTDHPSRARKLHRVAKSVVILDEVQTLPPHLMHPILDGIRELSDNYGASVVLSTATPPALLKRDDFPLGLDNVRPIIQNSKKMAASPAARRVKVDWRVDQPVEYQTIAEELVANDSNQALVVVHRRKDAKKLAELLPKSKRLHLSAQMCPAHRIEVVNEINRRLRKEEDCLVVATQLIEAGVDIDLPVVYRALAGIDSLAQAAGRCDREGKRTLLAGEPAGRFTVFLAETSPPVETLQKAMSTTQALFAERQESSEKLDIFDPNDCTEFFKRFYGLNALDAKNIQRERAGLNFANVGKAFQMIESNWSFPVVVPWPILGENAGEGMRRAEAFRENPCRATSRALQPYIVQIAKAAAREMEQEGIIEVYEESIGLPYTSFDEKWYDTEFGIVTANEGFTAPSKLMS